jgi:hypothetical protein
MMILISQLFGRQSAHSCGPSLVESGQAVLEMIEAAQEE